MSLELSKVCELQLGSINNDPRNAVTSFSTDFLIRPKIHICVSPLNNSICFALNDTVFMQDLETMDILPEEIQEFCQEKGENITSLYWHKTGPQSTILMVGTSEGNFIMFDLKTEEKICEYNFSRSPILKIKLIEQECRNPPRVSKHILIVYSGIVIRVLESTVLKYIEDPEQSDIFECQKFTLNGQKKINDVVFIEREKNDSVMDVLQKKRDDCFISGGIKPCLVYYNVGAVDSKASGGTNVAKKITNYFYNVAKSWSWWGGSSDQKKNGDDSSDKSDYSDEEDEKRRPKMNIPNHQVSSDLSFFDSPREIYDIKLNKTATFAIMNDSLGRVMVVDTSRFLILKLLKGYREAQCFWIHRSRRFLPQTINFFMIVRPLRGFVELWSFLPGSVHGSQPMSVLKTASYSKILTLPGDTFSAMKAAKSTTSSTSSSTTIPPKQFFLLQPDGSFNAIKFRPPNQYNPFNVTVRYNQRKPTSKSTPSRSSTSSSTKNKSKLGGRSSGSSSKATSLISTIPIDRINLKDEELFEEFQRTSPDLRSWKKVIKNFESFDYVVRCLDFAISCSSSSSTQHHGGGIENIVSTHIDLSQFAYRSFTGRKKKLKKINVKDDGDDDDLDEIDTIKKFIEERIRFLQAYQMLGRFFEQHQQNEQEQGEDVIFGDDDDNVADIDFDSGDEEDEDGFVIIEEFASESDDEDGDEGENEKKGLKKIKRRKRRRRKRKKKKKKKKKKKIQEDWFQHLTPDLIEKMLKVEDDCYSRISKLRNGDQYDDDDERKAKESEKAMMTLQEFMDLVNQETSWVAWEKGSEVGRHPKQPSRSFEKEHQHAHVEGIGGLLFGGEMEENWDGGNGPLKTVLNLFSSRIHRIPYALCRWILNISLERQQIGKMLCVPLETYVGIILHCLTTSTQKHRFIARIIELSQYQSSSYFLMNATGSSSSSGSKQQQHPTFNFSLMDSVESNINKIRNGRFLLLIHLCRNLLQRIRRKRREIMIAVESHIIQRTDVLRLQSILPLSPVGSLFSLSSSISSLMGRGGEDEEDGDDKKSEMSKRMRKKKKKNEIHSEIFDKPSLYDILSFEQILRMNQEYEEKKKKRRIEIMKKKEKITKEEESGGKDGKSAPSSPSGRKEVLVVNQGETDVETKYFDFSSADKLKPLYHYSSSSRRVEGMEEEEEEEEGEEVDEEEGISVLIGDEISLTFKLFPQFSNTISFEEDVFYFSAANQCYRISTSSSGGRGDERGRQQEYRHHQLQQFFFYYSETCLKFVDAIPTSRDQLARISWYVLQWNRFVEDVLRKLVMEILMKKEFVVSDALAKIGFEDEKQFMNVLLFHRKLVTLLGRELYQNEQKSMKKKKKKKDEFDDLNIQFESDDEENDDVKFEDMEETELEEKKKVTSEEIEMKEQQQQQQQEHPPKKRFWFDLGMDRLSQLKDEVQACHIHSKDLEGYPQFLYFLQILIEIQKEKKNREYSRVDEYQGKYGRKENEKYEIDLEVLYTRGFLDRIITPFGVHVPSHSHSTKNPRKSDSKLRFKRKGFFKAHLPQHHQLMLKLSKCFDDISKDFVNLEIMKILFSGRKKRKTKRRNTTFGFQEDDQKQLLQKGKEIILQINSSVKIGSTLIGICREKMRYLVTLLGKDKRKMHLLSQMDSRLYKWVMTAKKTSDSDGEGDTSFMNDRDLEREEEDVVKQLRDLLQIAINHLSAKKKSIPYRKAQKMMSFVQKLDF